MNWRNYLFFTKGEKIAIVILLLLIVLSGVLYVITLPKKSQYTHKEIQAGDIREKQKTLDSTTANNSYINSQTPNSLNNKRPNIPIKLKAGETIELNSADTTILKKIPGIGSAYAKRIIKYKNLLGGYADARQLKEVWGVDEELFVKIAPFIRVKKETLKIKINSASFDEMNKHPYISYKQAKVITDIRMRKGKIESFNRLSLLDEFKESDIERLNDYITFE